MKYQIVKEFPHPILEKCKKPVVSIYIDTKIKKPESFENPIRFKNLVKEAQRSLQEKAHKNFKALFDLFEEMETDRFFWETASQGIAILADDEECIVYKLPMDVPNQAIVADSFYIKPLLKSYQSSRLYHVLSLSRDRFSLYEADRKQIFHIPVGEEHSTLEGVLGEEKTDPHLTVGAYGGGDQAMYHGHGGAKDEKQVDQERFFRYVDNYILEQYSKTYKIPLILVGLDENQGEFRKISKNTYLIDENVKIDAESLDQRKLHGRVQAVMEGIFNHDVKERMELFAQAHAKDMGSDDMVQIGKAIAEGRVASLYLDGSKVHPGRFDPKIGTIVEDELLSPYTGDIYDDMAETVLSLGGEVIILEESDMPTERDIAAIYRY